MSELIELLEYLQKDNNKRISITVFIKPLIIQTNQELAKLWLSEPLTEINELLEILQKII